MSAALGATLVLALLGAGVTATIAQTLQPLVVDWEQYFRIESDTSTRAGRSVVRGTVWNTATWSAKRIQLLVDAVDGQGRVTDQRVVWLGIDLGGGAHAFFEVPMPSSASYRVRVYAFDSGRGGRWSRATTVPGTDTGGPS